MQKETLVISFIKFTSFGKVIYLEFNGPVAVALDYLRACYPECIVLSSETEISETPLPFGISSFTGEPYLVTKPNPLKMERKKMMWLVYGSIVVSLALLIAIVCLAIAFNFILWLFGGIIFLFVVVVGLMYSSKRRVKNGKAN
jgi:hypothetical protein